VVFVGCSFTYLYRYYCQGPTKGVEKVRVSNVKTPSEDLEDLWSSPDFKSDAGGHEVSFTMDAIDLYDPSITGSVEMITHPNRTVSLFEESQTRTGSVIKMQQRSSVGLYHDREGGNFFWRGESAYQLQTGSQSMNLGFMSPMTPTLTTPDCNRMFTMPRLSRESIPQKRFLQTLKAASSGQTSYHETKREVHFNEQVEIAVE